MLTKKLPDKTKFKHVVFDFDGVIAETDLARFKTLSKILLKYNINLEQNHTLFDIIGIPTDIFLTNNIPILSKKDIKSIIEERRVIFLSDLEYSCIAYPGAAETIQNLSTADFLIHLATTNDKHVAQKLLKHIGVSNSFKSCFFREDIVNKNTNKKDYGLFLSKTKINPEEIIVVEDSVTGVQSAKENSIFCVAFNRNNNQNISKLADVSLKTFDDLRCVFNLLKKHRV